MSSYDDELKANIHKFIRDVQTNSALQEELIQYFKERFTHAIVVLEFADVKGYKVNIIGQEALTQWLTLEKEQLEFFDRHPELVH